MRFLILINLGWLLFPEGTILLTPVFLLLDIAYVR